MVVYRVEELLAVLEDGQRLAHFVDGEFLFGVLVGGARVLQQNEIALTLQCVCDLKEAQRIVRMRMCDCACPCVPLYLPASAVCSCIRMFVCSCVRVCVRRPGVSFPMVYVKLS